VISRQKEIAEKIGNETDLQNGRMLAVMFMLSYHPWPLGLLRMMIRASISLAVV
jgi:hypothetical protein